MIFTRRLTPGFGILKEVLLLESLLDLFGRRALVKGQRFGVAVVHTCSAMTLSLRTGRELDRGKFCRKLPATNCTIGSHALPTRFSMCTELPMFVQYWLDPSVVDLPGLTGQTEGDTHK